MIPGNTSSQGKYVDPPTSVSASAGNAQATVTFTLPVYDGKGTATYVATASPGGATASGSSSPLVVTGLSNGTSYTFTVSTISGYGVSAASAASAAVTPTAPAPSFPPTFTPPSFTPVCTPVIECINDACSICPVGTGACGSAGLSCYPVSAQLNSNCSRTCLYTSCGAGFAGPPAGC